MFREERLDATNPSLRDARFAATAALFGVSGAPMNEPTLAELARTAEMWSLVHGFAVLAVDKRLMPILRLAPPGTGPLELFEAIQAARPSPGAGKPDSEA
jgi:hypothetical protein